MKNEYNLLATYWFARGYFDGRTSGSENDDVVGLLEGELLANYRSGFDSGVADYCELDIESDGQPDEAQEWHDFDPDC
jgi:hypothetical protein